MKKTEEIQRQVAREARKVEVLRESNSIAYSQSLEEKLQVYMRITRPAIDEVYYLFFKKIVLFILIISFKLFLMFLL